MEVTSSLMVPRVELEVVNCKWKCVKTGVRNGACAVKVVILLI